MTYAYEIIPPVNTWAHACKLLAIYLYEAGKKGENPWYDLGNHVMAGKLWRANTSSNKHWLVAEQFRIWNMLYSAAEHKLNMEQEKVNGGLWYRNRLAPCKSVKSIFFLPVLGKASREASCSISSTSF